MKISICNVPLLSEDLTTTYPPLGAMYVMQSLQTAGFETEFYDINLYRPSDQEIADHYKNTSPQIVGISATVSTSYFYTKKLANIIRKVLPKCVIVVGGAITASAEILLKMNPIDICVIGEGETTIVELATFLKKNNYQIDREKLKTLNGLSFLNEKGHVEFTGYQIQLPMHDIPDPDYELIKKFSRVDAYIVDPFRYPQFKRDKRSFQKHVLGKRMATVVGSRGCVARCTFCHRWQKGLRIFTVDRVIKHIQFLKENYNVGFVSFGDEDFGASKKWVDELIEKITPLNILYRISATRVDHNDLDILKRHRAAGCVAVHYGFESGSDRILTVMEKRSSTKLNTQVARWTYEAGLQTVPALVVGMPGESYSTIRDTTAFLKKVTEFYDEPPETSPNILVALPGTPVYEFARMKGFLGDDLKGEEKYLLRVSDQGGESPVQLNFTDYPYFIVQTWVRWLILASTYHYYKKNKLKRISTLELCQRVIQYGLSTITKLEISKSNKSSIFTHPLIYAFGHVILLGYVIVRNYREVDSKLFKQRILELLKFPFKKKEFTEYISLRQFMNKRTAEIDKIKRSLTNLSLLRLGR